MHLRQWFVRRLAAFRTWRAERAWARFQQGCALKQAQYQARRQEWTDRYLALEADRVRAQIVALGENPRPGASATELTRQLEDLLRRHRMVELQEVERA